MPLVPAGGRGGRVWRIHGLAGRWSLLGEGQVGGSRPCDGVGARLLRAGERWVRPLGSVASKVSRQHVGSVVKHA